MNNNAKLPILLLLGLLTIPRESAIAQAEMATNCGDIALLSAVDQYEIGLFDEAIGVLRPCLPSGFQSKPDRLSAYRLLALSYIVTDSLQQANQSVKELLRLDRGYEANPDVDPPLFTDMVQDAKPAWYTWFYQGHSIPQWLGRTAIVGAAVGIPLLLRDETLPPLPEPPALPSQ